MKVKLTSITPSLAEEMLKKNMGNRPLNILHADKLAKEMVSGRWKVNGDTICLNGDRIIDGQHRLHAIIQSGITCEILVVDGLDYDVFDTKDVGKRRSPGDTLGARGEKNACRLAAALVLIDKYVTGRIEKSVAYSNTEMEELLMKYPAARFSIQTNNSVKGLLTPAVLDACHYIFSRKDPVMADMFVDKVMRGTDLSEGSPWYVLREKLVNNSLAKAKLNKSYLMALCIKAWNHSRTGTTVKVLKYAQDGINSEAFPIAR